MRSSSAAIRSGSSGSDGRIGSAPAIPRSAATFARSLATCCACSAPARASGRDRRVAGVAGRARRRELVEHVFEEDFSTAEDADIQQDLEKKLEALGLDPRLARQIVEIPPDWAL